MDLLFVQSSFLSCILLSCSSSGLLVVQRLDSLSLPSYSGQEVDTQRNHAQRAALLSPREQDGKRRYKTLYLLLWAGGREEANHKSLWRAAREEYEDKRQNHRDVSYACKERGGHTEGIGAQQWWLQLCKGKEFEGRKKESSLLITPNQIFPSSYGGRLPPFSECTQHLRQLCTINQNLWNDVHAHC